MGDGDTDFIRSLSVADSGELTKEAGILQVYRGTLADGSGRSARFITLSPDTDREAVADAFAQAAGQWHNTSTHPNIVSVYDRGDRPRPWVAVEDPQGERLGGAQSELTLREAASAVSDTAEAVRNAALYNTTHLNLSPEAVWVVEGRDGPRALVDDWGLERAVRAADGERATTPYTPPELREGEATGDGRADVYGLGAVAYYALTGQPPSAESEGAGGGPGGVTPPSVVVDDLSPAIDDVIVQALSTDPRDRQGSAYDFKQVFDRVTDAELPERDRTEPDQYSMSWTDPESDAVSVGSAGEQQGRAGDAGTAGEERGADDEHTEMERSTQEEATRGGLPTPVVGLFGGALAFCLSFVGVAGLLFYESAANAEVLAATPNDLLLQVGWLTYNAHQVPVAVAVEGGASENLLRAAYGSTTGPTTIPEVAYYLLPAAVLFLVGYLVGRGRAPGRPGRGAVCGAALGVGYGLLASVGAASVFRFTEVGTPIGPPLATTVLMMGVVYPVVAGGLGGAVGGR